MHGGPRRTGQRRRGRRGRRLVRLLGLLVAVVTTATAAVLVVTTSAVRDPGPVPRTAAGGRAALLVHEAGGVASSGTDLAAAGPTSDVRLRSRVTRVAGHLSDVRRERVARQAHATVLASLEAAAGGGPPGEGFVRGLRSEARADASVLGGAEGVGPADARAWFAVAAPHGRAVGVTARLAVTLPSDDGSTVSVTGRLLLTRPTGGGGPAWQVFGYDLARGTR